MSKASTRASRPEWLVGIGASAGGLAAIEGFFANTPADSGLAFVVVQHLSPDFKSMMNELLARHTAMEIHLVEDGMELEPNGIYLIPPRKNMVISKDKLMLSEQASSGLHLPIDIFFQSLAENYGNRGIAIVLSGTGSDGSRGLQSVHESGGLVLVQDIDSSGFDGMPRNAIATGMSDVICAPGDMPKKILEFTADPDKFVRGQFDYPDTMEADNDKISVFRLFRRRYGIDFSLYKPTTINRRLDRRVQLSRAGTLENYIRLLEEDTDELDLLYRDLLVEVTHFFRDAEAFDRLRFELVPEIVQNATDEIRAWVPGCATGEEAYSLAMIFRHVLRSTGGDDIEVKVFATDVHQKSLEAAGAGVYRPESMANLPEDYRKDYFTKAGDLFHLSREIREMVVFAPHDITKDPPFTRLDLISCRNVLIYLEPDVQKRVLSMYHFGLRTGGVMFLGPSETVGDLDREFEVLDQHWRIYRKLRDVRLPETAKMSTASALARGVIPGRRTFRAKPIAKDSAVHAPDIMDKLLNRYVPPSLLVNQYHELLHSFGDARRFLRQPEGSPTLDILRMIDGDLRTAVSAAIHRASGDNIRIVYRDVRIRDSDSDRYITVAVEPFTRQSEKLFLVNLEESEPPVGLETRSEQFNPEAGTDQQIVDLERELSYTRESLQATVEELETSNEELQSTNEELIASNEELQSTNEELHSVNEELYTVNAEHQRKIDELKQVTADIENLLRCTEIGIVFLDGQMKIREFTPAVTGILHLIEQDVGRPIDHIAGNISTTNLMNDIRNSVEVGGPIENRVVTRDGHPYLQRVVPYVSADNAVDGVILTFTSLKAVEDIMARARQTGKQLEDHQTLVYAVSHDMQAPLRQIRDQVNVTTEAIKTDDHNALTDALGAISTRVNRMEVMLDGLLKFSRVLTRGAEFADFDLSQILLNTQSTLRTLIRSSAAEISSGRLPTLSVDEEQIEVVFTNLIDNAIKYCDEPPRIDISATRAGSDWVICFADNGIGINERHHERIFTVFQRLEFKDVEGDGMGLAMARRIVERHGGSLTVESKEGSGSKFLVRLPGIEQRAAEENPKS
jgi:two-component system CheB/CheR fusion protein